MTTSTAVRARIVETFRRDLIGPNPEPDDADLQRERLSENPSRWYLAGFIAPADEEQVEAAADNPATQEEGEAAGLFDEPDAEAADGQGAGGAAGDDEDPEPPSAKRRFLPSSVGLTVLLPVEIEAIEVLLTWGDYVTEPPLPPSVLLECEAGSEVEGPNGTRSLPRVDWVRLPQERVVVLPISDGRGSRPVPESAAQQMARGGGLELTWHARSFTIDDPEAGPQRVRALTVFLVNRRTPARRRYADVAYAFQARVAIRTNGELCPRFDLSGYRSEDPDLRLADLHYRDVREYAVGRNAAANWHVDEDRRVRCAWTDFLPRASVEKVAPNEHMPGVEFGMEALAALADTGATPLVQGLEPLVGLYDAWIDGERAKAASQVAPRRREAAEQLVIAMTTARDRIADGLTVLRTDDWARLAFRIMNLAIARAARRRNAGANGDPAAQQAPRWRPFQLAFILLNLRSLVDKGHPDREIVDLLFFPTGGGKTEAYLGLAAFAIAHRRLAAGGVLGAGITVIMRYTLRLLTLDQLGRAAGVVCALELMREDPAFLDAQGRRLLGDWPIEIGLWVGSDASPNRLGGRGDTGDDTAVTRVRRFRTTGQRAPAPIKSCPWCGTPFDRDSFSCVPNTTAPTNLEIRCANAHCDFTGDRALPVLTVDEPIYRRLPAFLIATVDKFASLPWLGESGAFFGHVDRFDPQRGFFGPAGERSGTRLNNGWTLDPPDLIIQDELHLISGPLGTVAGLYETAIDRLATRVVGDHRIRPKIVASTATVRRAAGQIRALFDRDSTAVFPPPGVERTDSFFACTVDDAGNPPRWYLGIAAQGRGPKLVFLRALTTLVAAAQSEYEAAAARGGNPTHNPADPYMTALCYFNALRELGGARRIVEDEVRNRALRYGTERRRVDPADQPFRDRALGEVMELTSRVSTDQVAEAKRRLELAFGAPDVVDVALATNMISVGLDITRLGLMLVQGQPKTAAEYIQATSRVGRDARRPGLVLTVLNVHKPRDRVHYEQFCQFHRTFYRAVEATSVTPWAARALDRALAAVVVAIGRHIDPTLTPERAVDGLRNDPTLRDRVRDAIVDRAPDDITGGKAALAQTIDGLLADWMDIADDKMANGQTFAYTRKGAPQHLLWAPLDPALPNLSPAERRFTAGRSMRDVEPNSLLNVRDPFGGVIANADDLG